MNRLVPHFILSQFSQNIYQGSLKASVLFVDISGFTSMTENLMKHSKEGAEILSDNINQLFGFMIDEVYANEGFISTFAGDAFTAIFENDTGINSLACAKSITEFFKKESELKTKFGSFNLSCRIGISSGIVGWKIITEESNSYYFYGKPVFEAVECEKNAPLNQIVSTENYHWNRACISTSIGNKMFIINVDKEFNEKRDVSIDYNDETLKEFYPEQIIKSSLHGEFRNLFSVFCSFLNDEELIKDLTNVNRMGGFLDLIDTGDKGNIMFFLFGAPVSYKSQERFVMNFIFDNLKKHQEKVKFAVTFGTVFAGFIGNEKRITYTALGDSVNLSSRMLEKALFGSVVCDENALKLFKNNVKVISSVFAPLKGKSDTVNIFEIAKSESETNDKTEEKIIGRDETLESIIDFLDKNMFFDKPLLIQITGDVGSGKSVLIKKLTEETEGKYIIKKASAEQILKKGFNPFKRILKEEFNLNDERPPTERIESADKSFKKILREFKNDLIIEENIISALLYDFFDLNSKNPLLSQMNVKDRYDNLMYSLMLLLRFTARDKKVLICIDDYQFIDSDSIALADYLLKNKVPVKMILICRRIEDMEFKNNFEWTLKHVDLKNLSQSEVNEIAESELGLKMCEDSLNEIMNRTKGNPFFTKQILQYLKMKNMLVKENMFYKISGDANEMPATLNGLLVSFMDSLNPKTQHFISSASVLGNEMKEDYLRMVVDSADFDMMLQETLAQGLFEKTEFGIIRFSQPMLCIAAYEMQLKQSLRKQHLGFAKKLAESKGKNREFQLVGYHYEQAENFKEAGKYYDKALKIYKAKYKNQESINLYRKLIELADSEIKRASLKLLLGDLFYEIGMWKECEILYLESVETFKNHDDTESLIGAYNSLSNLYRVMSRFDDAHEIAQRAIEKAKNIDSMELAISSMSAQSIINMSRGKTEEAFEILSEQLKISEKKNVTDKDKSMIYSNLSNYYWGIADYDRAIENIANSLKYIEKKDKSGIASQISNLGGIYWYQGDIKKSKTNYLKALKITKKIGAKHAQSIITGNLLSIYFSEGNNAKAFEYGTEKLKMSKELGDKKGETFAYLNLASLYYTMKNTDKAKEYYSISLDLSRKYENAYAESVSLGNISEIFSSEGDYDKALDCLMKKLEIADRTKNEKTIATTYSSLGSLFMEMEDYEQALESFDRAEDLLVKLNLAGDISYVKELKGNIAVKQMKYEEAEKLFEEAVNILPDRTQKVKLARIGFEVADLYEKMNRLEDALEKIKLARETAKKTTDMELICDIKAMECKLKYLSGDSGAEFRLEKTAKKCAEESLGYIYKTLYEMTKKEKYRKLAQETFLNLYKKTNKIKFKKESEVL